MTVSSAILNVRATCQPRWGLIAFHDIDYSHSVRRFWDEIKVGRRFQEIRDDHGQNFGIGLIYN